MSARKRYSSARCCIMTHHFNAEPPFPSPPWGERVRVRGTPAPLCTLTPALSLEGTRSGGPGKGRGQSAWGDKERRPWKGEGAGGRERSGLDSEPSARDRDLPIRARRGGASRPGRRPCS